MFILLPMLCLLLFAGIMKDADSEHSLKSWWLNDVWREQSTHCLFDALPHSHKVVQLRENSQRMVEGSMSATEKIVLVQKQRMLTLFSRSPCRNHIMHSLGSFHNSWIWQIEEIVETCKIMSWNINIVSMKHYSNWDEACICLTGSIVDWWLHICNESEAQISSVWSN
jgi:hypothetical protein